MVLRMMPASSRPYGVENDACVRSTQWSWEWCLHPINPVELSMMPTSGRPSGVENDAYVQSTQWCWEWCLRPVDPMELSMMPTSGRPNGIENDAYVRPPNLTSASCDLDLWPFNPWNWSFHALALWTTCASLHQNWFIHFTDGPGTGKNVMPRPL